MSQHELSRVGVAPIASRSASNARPRLAEADAGGGGARILLGIVLAGIGVALTSGSRSGSGVTVYYGLVWVGVETILRGLWCVSTGLHAAEMGKGTRFGFGALGLLVALVFLAAQTS